MKHKLLVLFIAVLVLATALQAGTITSTATGGKWSATTTWVGGVVPGASDVKALPGRPVFLGFPASWDFMWVYWYLLRFTGERPFREHAIDVRSYAMGMRKVSFAETTRTYLPKRWFDEGLPHTHVALDDALEQGAMFCNMLAENRRPGGGGE